MDRRTNLSYAAGWSMWILFLRCRKVCSMESERDGSYMGLNLEDAAWLAGFYEGDGSVYVVRGRWLSVKITQKETSVLRYIKNLLGYGEIYSEYKGKFRVSKWMVVGSKARDFLDLIYPYMKARLKISQVHRAFDTVYAIGNKTA
jgi:hypothetical protein